MVSSIVTVSDRVNDAALDWVTIRDACAVNESSAKIVGTTIPRNKILASTGTTTQTLIPNLLTTS